MSFPADRKFRSIADLFYTIRAQIKDDAVADQIFRSTYDQFLADTRINLTQFENGSGPNLIASRTNAHSLTFKGRDKNINTIYFPSKSYKTFGDMYLEIKKVIPSYSLMIDLFSLWMQFAFSYDSITPRNVIEFSTSGPGIPIPVFQDGVSLEDFVFTIIDAITGVGGVDSAKAVLASVNQLMNTDNISLRRRFGHLVVDPTLTTEVNRLFIDDEQEEKIHLPASRYNIPALFMSFKFVLSKVDSRISSLYKRKWGEIQDAESRRLKARKKRSVSESSDEGTVSLHRMCGIYILCDLIQEQPIASTCYPILRIIGAFKYNQKTGCYAPSQKETLTPWYVSLRKQNFRTISMSIAGRAYKKSEEGGVIPDATPIWIEPHGIVPSSSSRGGVLSTQIVLHFRKSRER